MKKLIFIIIILSFLTTKAQKNTDFFNEHTELKYENGKIKEIADWKNGLIIGSRKFFDKEGKLIEEHSFKEEHSIKDETGAITGISGVLKTFYADGSVASEIPVEEQLRDSRGTQEYTLRIASELPIQGFHPKSQQVAYRFTLDKQYYLTGSRITFYKDFNQYFYDIFLLHDDRNLIGLRADIEYFHPDGKLKAKGEINNGKKKDTWVFYYENGQVESKGNFLPKGLEKDFKSGTWIYYNETGQVIKEESYFNGVPNKNIKYGDLSGISKYYYLDGKLKLVLRSPLPNEVTYYTDTIEEYFPSGQVKYRYIDTLKLDMPNGMPYKYSGKYEEYYENGEFKMLGFLGKNPRVNVLEQDVSLRECILKPENKKLSFWYFFNEKGDLVKVTEYNLCGDVKNEFSENEVQKENNRYKMGGKNYEFDFRVKF